jgi:hypothetical protein
MKSLFVYKETHNFFTSIFLSLIIAWLSVYFPMVAVVLALLIILHLVLLYRPILVYYGILLGYPFCYMFISPSLKLNIPYGSLSIQAFDFLIIYTTIFLLFPYFFSNRINIKNQTIHVILKFIYN